MWCCVWGSFVSGASFTAGPWLADFHNEQRDGGRFITYIRGGNQLVPISAVPTGVEGYGREEGRANARLIAAAPALLEALEDIASSARGSGPYARDRDADTLAMIERVATSAIAKSTGASA